MAMDQTNQKPYQLGRQALTIVPFAIIALLKAVIYGGQSIYTELAPSTSQVGLLELPLWYLILTLFLHEAFVLCFLVLFVCVEVLRPRQQLRLCRAGQLPINTVPGQA